MNPIKIFLLIYACLNCSDAFAQDQPYAISALVVDTVTWWDEQGQNLLLMEQSELVRNEDEGTSSQWITVTHWLKENNTLTKTWSYQDSIVDCPIDLELRFLAEPQFPDIDKDGYKEIFFMIQSACKGDISPSIVQVIMVDKKRIKYFMEANQKLIFPDGTTDGGDYDLGDFKELSKAYQDHAIKYLTEYYTYMYLAR